MAPNLLKWPTAPRGRPKRLNQAFFPRPKTFLQKGLRSVGALKLLKWGLTGRGVKSAKVQPTPYAYYPRVVCGRVGPRGGAPCCVQVARGKWRRQGIREEMNLLVD